MGLFKANRAEWGGGEGWRTGQIIHGSLAVSYDYSTNIY